MKQFYTSIFAFLILSFVTQGQKLHIANAGTITGDGSQTCRIATDSKGFVYIAGSFTGTTLSFNGTTVPGNGNSVYLAKYDTSENLIWVKTYGGNATLSDITIDKNSDIFLVGNFSSSSSFDTYTLTSTGKQDVFYTKITSAGNVAWAKQAGGDSSDIGIGISTDQFDNIYLCGNFFSDTFSIGSQQINIYKQGNQDYFYAKLDANGNAIWLKAPSIANINLPGASFSLDKIKVADDGSVYLSGLAIPNPYVGADTLSFTPPIPQPVGPPTFDISKGRPPLYGSSGTYYINVFVKLDPNGVTLKQFGQSGYSRGSKEANFVFRKQYLYAAFSGVGLDYHGFILQKEDTATSLIPNNEGQYSLVSGSYVYYDAIDMDMGKNGNVFSAMAVNPYGYTALLLNDSNLNFLDSLKLPTFAFPNVSIAADTNNNIAFFADNYNSAQPVTIGTDVLPATAGNTNVFFIKTRNTLKPVSVKVDDTVVCTGQTVQLHALVSNGYPTYKYAWKPTTGLSDSTISNPTVSPASDSVQYIVTVTDSIGEISTDTAMVYVNSSNTLTITNPAPVCGPATIDLSSSSIITGNRAGIKLEYFKNQAATDTLKNPTHIDSSGTYFIKASSITGCNTTPIITPVIVVVNPQPGLLITASGPTSFCGGDSVILTAPAAPIHLWISGDTTASVVAKTTGTYEVTSTNNNGCSSTNEVYVSVGAPAATLTLVSAPATKLQTVNGNSPITPIIYTTNASSLALTNFPQGDGFTSSISGDTLTISGSVTANINSFTYNVSTVGGCGVQRDTCELILSPYHAILVSASTSDEQSICPHSSIAPIKYYVPGGLGLSNVLTAAGLPAGITVGASGDTIIISGTPTPSSGISYYNLGGYDVGGYINIDSTLYYTLNLTSAASTTTQSLCVNTAIIPITYVSGTPGFSINDLPSGLATSYSSQNGTITISGSPSITTGSPFNYSITTTNGCIPKTVTGVITVNPDPTLTLNSSSASTSQSVYVNTPIAPIIYITGGGATGVIVDGLPAGLTAIYSGDTLTINGIPTTAIGSPYNYTVNTTGTCVEQTATGSIAVTPIGLPILTSAVGTDNQSVCENNPITKITYYSNGLTGISTNGLPAGVNATYNNDTITISGTPVAAAGTFHYDITTTGASGQQSIFGSITSTYAPYTISVTDSSDPTSCGGNDGSISLYPFIGSAAYTVNYLKDGIAQTPVTVSSTTVGYITINGLTQGSYSNIIVTNASGCTTNAVTTTLSDPAVTMSLTSATATTTQTVCIYSPIVPITYSVGGTGVTISSLPAGVTGTYTNGVVTIDGSPTSTTGSPFAYSLTTTGSCLQKTLTGTITVNPLPSITIDSTQCAIDLLSYSIYATTSAGTLTSNIGTVTNLSSNKWVISGIATNTNATLTLISNGCSTTQLVTSPNCANCPSVSAPVSGGDQTACAQTPLQTLTATASAPANYTIKWYDIPSGGNIVTNPTLSIIATITYYAEADGISSPTCHSSTRTPVTLSIVASPVLSITDPAPVCTPATVDITNPFVTVGSIFPAGTTLTYYSDVAATNIVTDPNTINTSATYYLKASTPDVCTDIKPVTVIINQGPATPVITQTNDTLISNTTIGNHWYEDGILLSGENSDTLVITTSGFYSVRLSNNAGCYSDSASIQLIVPANRPVGFTHQEFPNPATNVLNIWYTLLTPAAVGITLADINGKEVSILLEKQQQTAGSYQLSIDNIAKLPGGTYFVHYSINNKDTAEKIIIL